MKKIVSAIIAVATLVLCFALSACESKYASNYSSTMLSESSSSNQASVKFSGFKGTYVMQLTNEGADEAFITYEASLGEGNIKVYYDYNDEKLNLFEIETGGSVEDKTETFTGNETIYIIIESDGKCKEGSFSFVLE